MLTATLRGAFGTGTVVVGPLKHASESSSSFHTSGEMYELPPFFSHHSEPASHCTSSILVLHAFRTLIIALTSSGPVPSPLIIAAVFKSNQMPSLGFSIYSYLDVSSAFMSMFSLNGGTSAADATGVNSFLSE